MASFGLDAVLSEIMAKFGQAELYLQAPDTNSRANLVLQVLAQMRGLLIWDNFESVASMPEPGQATPPLDEAKQQELAWFIGELDSLTASIAYSFRHLPEADRQRLVILSLFENTASAPILGVMQNSPNRIAGLDINGWDALLSRLAGLGLVTGLGGALYRLHPALPPFLASLWRSDAGVAYADEREPAFIRTAGSCPLLAQSRQGCRHRSLA